MPLRRSRKGAENGGGDDDELDSDEDWDTSEWGKEDVESACMALLDEIEKPQIPSGIEWRL